jgi:hypothetical protein
VRRLTNEISAKQVLIETNSHNRHLVQQLQQEKSELEEQLTIKRENLSSLQVENSELLRKCYDYINSIDSYRKKQQEIEELENEQEGKLCDKRVFIEIGIKRKELFKLETKLEKIIEEEKPALMKKLKMNNEN